MSQLIEAMSDLDLLAMMLGSKTAERMLHHAGGRLSTLLNESQAACEPEPKIKLKLLVAKELVRRSLMEVMGQRDVLSSPASVRDYLRMTLAGRDYEVFMVLFLDAQNRVIESEEMFRGTLSQTSVYPREVVLRALHHHAASVVLAHNHPSGSVQPSGADQALTRNLRAALALVDVRVLDHIIVGAGETLSMAEKGLM